MENNIKALREKHELTLKELSKLVHIDDSVISKMENGVQNISDKNAIILADFFHVSLDYLFGRDSEKLFQGATGRKTQNISYDDVISKLNAFSSKELIQITAVIDYIIESRSQGDELKIKVVNSSDNLITK